MFYKQEAFLIKELLMKYHFPRFYTIELKLLNIFLLYEFSNQHYLLIFRKDRSFSFFSKDKKSDI